MATSEASSILGRLKMCENDDFITAFVFQEAWSSIIILDPDPTDQVMTDLDPDPEPDS